MDTVTSFITVSTIMLQLIFKTCVIKNHEWTRIHTNQVSGVRCQVSGFRSRICPAHQRHLNFRSLSTLVRRCSLAD